MQPDPDRDPIHRRMRRAVLLVAAALSLAMLLSTTASAHRERERERGRVAAAAGGSRTFASCPRQFNGTKSFAALAVDQIGVLRIPCTTAYRYIERFPAHLRPYRCTHRFTAGDRFKYICTDDSKAFRFTAQGE
jgi:hypothetical protein